MHCKENYILFLTGFCFAWGKKRNPRTFRDSEIVLQVSGNEK